MAKRKKRENLLELNWAGKDRCLDCLDVPSEYEFYPCPEESVNFDTTENLFFECDNLEALKYLQQTHSQKVKCIYIDPPYNTGKKREYKDDFGDITGCKHSDWLNMMYPRLYLAKDLLRDDGVCFISIDDHEVHNLRKICDEIFGEENFVGEYVKQSKIGGGSDSRHIVKEHEYCICYSKSINNLPEMFIEHDTDYLKRYTEQDENGRYFWDTFARPGLKNPIIYEIIAPDGTKIKKGWIRSKERFNKEYEENIIRIIKKANGEWSVQFKQYLNEDGKKPRSMTMDFGGTIEGKNEFVELFSNNRIFLYPKSTTYIKRLMKTVSTSGDNDIILDFFSGSATTAHATMQLNAEDGGNRKWITVQLPELCDEKSEAYKSGYKNICEIGKERIRRAGKKVLEEAKHKDIDVGFQVWKVRRKPE